jgi:DNA gyrase subunit B
MYIGGASPKGLLCLLGDIITDLLARPGIRPERVWCRLGRDGTYTVALCGGAIGPVDPEEFETDADDLAPNDPRYSLKVVSAFSDPLDAEVMRDGRRWGRRYAAGLPAGPLEAGPTDAPSSLHIRYRPDPAIFPVGTKLEYPALCGRAREWAAFHPHVRFTVEQEDDGQRRDYHYPAGLLSLAQEIEHQWWQWPWRGGASNVWRCQMTEGSEAAEAVFVHRPCGPAVIYSFVNGLRTSPEGSHVDGLRNNVAAVAANFGDDDPANPFAFDDRRDPLANLTVLLAVRLDNPQYLGSTKDVLGGDRPRDLIHRMIRTTLPGEIHRATGKSEG